MAAVPLVAAAAVGVVAAIQDDDSAAKVTNTLGQDAAEVSKRVEAEKLAQEHTRRTKAAQADLAQRVEEESGRLIREMRERD